MRQPLLLSLVLSGMIVATADAQPKGFLAITSPEDEDGLTYGPGATSGVLGFLQLFDASVIAADLRVRSRVYSPRAKDFIVAQEDLKALGKRLPGDRYPFQGVFVLPANSGTHMLKVDCFNLRAKEPARLIATQSMFFEVQKANAKGAADRQAERKSKTVTINLPSSGDKYGTLSNIAAGGTSTEEKVVNMSVRVLRKSDGVIMQDAIVKVEKGVWELILPNPMGGWPEGDVTLVARGLDRGGAEVAGEIHSLALKTVK